MGEDMLNEVTVLHKVVYSHELGSLLKKNLPNGSTT